MQRISQTEYVNNERNKNKKNAYQKEVVDFWENLENLTLTAPIEVKEDRAKQRVFVNELRGIVKRQVVLRALKSRKLYRAMTIHVLNR